MSSEAYRSFIAAKSHAPILSNCASSQNLSDRLFNHQRTTVEFALDHMRTAAFLDTGLGKSGVEACFAGAAAQDTGKPSLILTPLAVAPQMQRECEAFYVDAQVIRDASDMTGAPVVICNYERLSKLDPSVFGAVVLDESSILKGIGGATKRRLVDAFLATPYRLAATATPAPNDHMELGNHAEFLGIMSPNEMLSRWFINDTSTASQEWRLKGHSIKDFWQWVASWSRAASLPSDLGGDDSGYILPPLREHVHIAGVNIFDDVPDGQLFRVAGHSATEMHAEKRLTMQSRVDLAAQIANDHEGHVIVWCERDDESAALSEAVNGAVEVKGSMTLDAKENALDRFARAEIRALVTKPRMAGFGLNLQHVHRQVFASISHSYEAYYQAVRRSWRFGQESRVDIDIVIAETERGIWDNVKRKAADHDRLKASVAAAMKFAGRSSDKRAYNLGLEIELPEWIS